jgi:hypothetical protein
MAGTIGRGGRALAAPPSRLVTTGPRSGRRRSPAPMALGRTEGRCTTGVSLLGLIASIQSD